VESKCTLHQSMLCSICVPKIVNARRNLTKF